MVTVVAVVVGATVGGAAGALSAEEAATIKRAEQRMQDALKTVNLQPEFAAVLKRMALRYRFPMGALESGGAEADAALRLDARVESVTAETDGTRGLPASIVLTVKATLTHAPDGAVLDSMTTRWRSDLRPMDTWLAGDGKMIQQTFAEAFDELADRVLMEFFLKRPPDNDAKGDMDYPAWAIRPLSPMPVRQFKWPPLFPKAPSMVPAGYSPPVAQAPVRLRWEVLPRSVGPTATEVVYDLKVLSAVADERNLFWLPGRIVEVRTDLLQAEADLPPWLSPCSVYFWTVRARYRDATGHLAATEWSAHLADRVLKDLWAARRGQPSGWGSLELTPTGRYYAFRTPGWSCGS